MRRHKFRLLALLLLACGGGSWFLKVPGHWFWGEMYSSYPTIEKHVIHPWEEISETDARTAITNIGRQRETLEALKLPAAEMIKASFVLQKQLTQIQLRTISKEEARGLDYEFDEAPAPIFGEIMGEQIRVINIRDRFRSPDDLKLIGKLSMSTNEYGNLTFEPTVRAEVVALRRYKITRSLLFVLLALATMLIGQGQQRGWKFERLFGRKVIRFAIYSAGFAFATIGGGPAVAQQLLFKINKADQSQSQALKQDTPDPLKSGNDKDQAPAVPERQKKPVSTITIWLFGDVTGTGSHDRQAIVQYTDKSGFTLMQQNRQTSDAAATNGNVTAGWTFHPHRNFDLTATAGPAFNYNVRGQRSGYNNQINVFLISNWRTRFFQFSSLVKMFAPTSEKCSFGSRHIQTLRGPPGRTPRVLQGIALQMENWHVNGPGNAHWNEAMVGPAFNLGEVMGKPKSALSWFTVYPYTDFCRPQPSHTRRWDIRIQYKKTFSLSH